MRKARSQHFGIAIWLALSPEPPELPAKPADTALAVLQRLVQHFPAGDEVGEHPP